MTAAEHGRFGVPAVEGRIGNADEWVGNGRELIGPGRIVANERAGWQFDIELAVLALERKRPEQSCGFEAPEGVFFADAPGNHGRIGETKLRCARGVSGFIAVSEQPLIVAGLPVSDASAEMQDLDDAVGLAVERVDIGTSR